MCKVFATAIMCMIGTLVATSAAGATPQHKQNHWNERQQDTNKHNRPMDVQANQYQEQANC